MDHGRYVLKGGPVVSLLSHLRLLDFFGMPTSLEMPVPAVSSILHPCPLPVVRGAVPLSSLPCRISGVHWESQTAWGLKTDNSKYSRFSQAFAPKNLHFTEAWSQQKTSPVIVSCFQCLHAWDVADQCLALSMMKSKCESWQRCCSSKCPSVSEASQRSLKESEYSKFFTFLMA